MYATFKHKPKKGTLGLILDVGTTIKNITTAFFPLFSLFWSQLSTVLRNTTDMTIFKAELKTIYKPKKQKHYNYGDKISNSLLCRLRVGRSYLKSHGFSVNLSPTDKCLCGAVDDNKHFFLFCFLFQPERSEMLSKIKCLVPNFSCLSISLYIRNFDLQTAISLSIKPI